ncbi:MAG: hypothetical protein JW889_07180 [Verrucomicrobia bacterium]|nr:hypothetical protein [Verrucomicrobiota bacterium]
MRLASIPLPRRLASSSIPPVVGAILVVAIVMHLFGLILVFADKALLSWWIEEDGVVEWLTTAALMAAFVVALVVRARFHPKRERRAARRFWLVLGVLMLLGGLEEISYGQRVFGIPTPACFKANPSPEEDNFYNKQGELNLHNLVIYGHDMNKLIYGKVVTLVMFFYWVVVPIVYRAKVRFRRGCDRWGVPVMQVYQLALAVVLAALTYAVRPIVHHITEVLEMSGAFIFLVLMLHPYNTSARPV